MKLQKFASKWSNYNFMAESGPTMTPNARKCLNGFKTALKGDLGSDYTLTGFKPNHFSTSGFVENNTTGKVVYISINDIRNYRWFDDILYRSAKSTKDYTGGHNRRTNITNLVTLVKDLLD